MDRKVYRLAGTLFVICTLFLARRFAGAAGEGSALLGPERSSSAGSHSWESPYGRQGTSRDCSLPRKGELGSCQDRVLLAWLAWIGVVIGVAHLAVGWFGISLGAAASLPLVLGNIWFVVVGITFIGKRRGAETVQALEAKQQPETPPNWLERVKIIPALRPCSRAWRCASIRLSLEHRPERQGRDGSRLRDYTVGSNGGRGVVNGSGAGSGHGLSHEP